jgi:hypothetical protein
MVALAEKKSARLFVVSGPGRYAWHPDQSASAPVGPNEVQFANASEVPSPGTLRGYDDKTYPKLNGTIDPRTYIYITLMLNVLMKHTPTLLDMLQEVL